MKMAAKILYKGFLIAIALSIISISVGILALAIDKENFYGSIWEAMLMGGACCIMIGTTSLLFLVINLIYKSDDFFI